MVEENKIVNNGGQIVAIMNRYFTRITNYMNLKANKTSHREELVNILDTFKNHESVQRIKLAIKRATKKGDIPAKILKKSVDIYIKEITFIIND